MKNKIFMKFSAVILALVLLSGSLVNVNAQTSKVKFVKGDQKIDVMIGGKLFTTYQYPSNMEKPYLWPVYSPNGSDVTRGFPLASRPKERVDHPHHIGIWFNHGDVNGLDFWNNSSAIPADRKDRYGHIVVKEVKKAKNGKKGTLEVVSEWKDNKGNTLLVENVKYIFSGNNTSYTIDHISTLTAASGTVTFTDNKEHEKIVVTLKTGESITLRHRFFIQSGKEITSAQADGIFKDFSALY